MATQTTTVSGTQTIPEILEPYFTGDSSGITGLLPTAQSLFARNYQTVLGNPLEQAGLLGTGRIANLSPGQQQLGTAINAMQTPSQFATANQYGAQAFTGLQSLLGAQAPSVTAPMVSDQTMQQIRDVTAPNIADANVGFAGNVNAPTLSAPTMGQVDAIRAPVVGDLSMERVSPITTQALTANQLGAIRDVNAPTVRDFSMEAAQTGYRPNLRAFQIDDPEAFGTDTMRRYMSPYTQGVTNIAKRNALLDAQRAQLASNLAAGRKGTFGASGDILARAERERQLKLQMGDIQTRGLESAFQNAQQQFERDRAAQLGVEQANLQSKLGVQQLGAQIGTQTSLANLQNQQAAALANLEARRAAEAQRAQLGLTAQQSNQAKSLEAAQANLRAREAAQQLSAQQSLAAKQANMAVAQERAKANLQAAQEARGLRTTTGMQAQQANQAVAQERARQNQAAQLAVNQQRATQSLEAQRLNQAARQQQLSANQQAALSLNQLRANQALEAQRLNQATQAQRAQQNLQAALQTGQLRAQTGLQAQQANQAAALQAQAQRLGAAQGIGALSATTGQLGVAQQAADIDRLKMLGAYGDLQRAVAQQTLDARYQDVLRQAGFSEEQLGKMANILRGVPLTDTYSQTATTTPPPSFASQLSGLGLAGLSAYGLLNRQQ